MMQLVDDEQLHCVLPNVADIIVWQTYGIGMELSQSEHSVLFVL